MSEAAAAPAATSAAPVQSAPEGAPSAPEATNGASANGAPVEQVTATEAAQMARELSLEEHGDDIVAVDFGDGKGKRKMTLREINRQLVRGKFSAQKFEEAKKLREEAEQKVGVAQRFIEALKDPSKRRYVLKQLGVNEGELLEEYVREQEHIQKLTPAQREMMQVEEERRRVQKERQQFEGERQKAERERHEAQVAHEAKRIQGEITQNFNNVLRDAGIDAKSDPEIHGQFFRAMLEEARAMHEAGEPFDPRACFEDARKNIVAQMRFLSKIEPAYAERVFGDDFGAVEKKFREYSLSKLSQAQKSQSQVEHKRAPKREDAPKKKMSSDEFREFLRSKT